MDGDLLHSWRDGPTRDAVVGFVSAAATEGPPGFIPEADRIATFDNPPPAEQRRERR
jgi:hypothetical protein